MSNATVVSKAPGNRGDCLDADEIGAAFDVLPADDKAKLNAIETVFRGGTGFGPHELVHDAVCRAVLGDRKCPRDVPFMAFMVETMRSVANHEREKHARSVSLTAVPRHGEASEGPPDCPSDQLDPEEHLLEREAADIVGTFHRLLEDDPEAQLVLMGWADGHRDKDLRDVTGLDQAALDYAGKRLRSRIRKHFPNGWTS